MNPRLFADQIAYIVGHAEDRVVFTDLTFVPMLEALAGRLPTVEAYVLLTGREGMPETTLPNALCYEEMVEAESDDLEWRPIDEWAASTLCYTSGTTGKPKGVLYARRSMVLHTLMLAGSDAQGLRAVDTVLSVVPLFHANAWGLPYLAPMVGARLVLSGMRLDGESFVGMVDPVWEGPEGWPEKAPENYVRTLVYSLDSVAGFARRFVDNHTLMIVLGDHQPAPLITGATDDRSVPVHVIAGDPTLTRPFVDWGFQPSMLPAVEGPVRRMDAFRDWFVEAFSEPAPAPTLSQRVE